VCPARLSSHGVSVVTGVAAETVTPAATACGVRPRKIDQTPLAIAYHGRKYNCMTTDLTDDERVELAYGLCDLASAIRRFTVVRHVRREGYARGRHRIGFRSDAATTVCGAPVTAYDMRAIDVRRAIHDGAHVCPVCCGGAR
jgi:hypothetical protein